MIENDTNNMILGTCVQIKARMNLSVDSMTIDIYDKSGNLIIDNQEMTSLDNNIYEYLFQSTESMESGKYCAKLKAVKGSKEPVKQVLFVLESPCY